MSKVRIVQLLCPQRHCIIATAYESPDGKQIPEMTDHLRKQVEESIELGGMNPWCGICQSRKWTYEDQPTIYATMDAAMPWLQANSDRQAFTREYFRASRS
jgi:hypothetical protein